MSMKLQVRGPHDQTVITVPKKLVKAKGWEHGDELEWSINNDGALELDEASEK